MNKTFVGAEATVTVTDKEVIKNRTKKTWRHPKIDKKIRERRTRQEAKILRKLTVTPQLIETDTTTITMKTVKGEQLSKNITLQNIKKTAKAVTEMHKEDVYHGDLTTKNIMITPKQAYIIDFGLGGLNARIEDKAVDLHILQTVLTSEKPSQINTLWNTFKKNYSPPQKQEIFNKLEEVNKRGRYK